jgi:DNA repair exonuclease SbcCD ATPase subunit
MSNKEKSIKVIDHNTGRSVNVQDGKVYNPVTKRCIKRYSTTWRKYIEMGYVDDGSGILKVPKIIASKKKTIINNTKKMKAVTNTSKKIRVPEPMLNVKHICDDKYKYIIHISDVHIPLHLYSGRLDEYLYVFDLLYKEISAFKKSKLIIITGDLFHNKMKMDPDMFLVGREFLRRLAEFARVVIITGNHDCSTYNTARRDPISAVCEGLTRVHYLRRSGLYRFGDVIYVVSSVFVDGMFIKMSMIKRISGMKYYALYHETVSGASFYNMKTIQDYTRVDDFNGFDAVLLGHIHKRQKLADNIAYAGSLIQQNYGEDIGGHGFIIWNTESNRVHSFVDLKNKYGFININVNEGVVDDSFIKKIPSHMTEIRMKCNYSCTDISERDFIEKKLMEKYKPIRLNANIIRPKMHKSVEYKNDDYDTDEFVHTCITNLSGKLAPDVIKLHNDIRSALILPENTIHTWSIVSLEFKNILSYGKDIHNKITFIGGVNTICAPNTYGKTSIANMIIFALTGTTSVTKTKSKNMLNNNSNKGYIVLKLIINNINYKITHELGKGSRSKIDIEKEDKNGRIICVSGATRTISLKLLAELTCKIEQLLSVNVINNASIGHSVLFCTNKDRLVRMHEICGLDIYEKYMKICVERRKVLHGKFHDIELKYQTQKNLINMYSDDGMLPSLLKTSSVISNDIEKNKQLLKLYESKINNHKRQIIPNLKLTRDIDSIEKDICDNSSFNVGKPLCIVRHLLNDYTQKHDSSYDMNLLLTKSAELKILLEDIKHLPKYNDDILVQICVIKEKMSSLRDGDEVKLTNLIDDIDIVSIKAEISKNTYEPASELYLSATKEKIDRTMNTIYLKELYDKKDSLVKKIDVLTRNINIDDVLLEIGKLEHMLDGLKKYDVDTIDKELRDIDYPDICRKISESNYGLVTIKELESMKPDDKLNKVYLTKLIKERSGYAHNIDEYGDINEYDESNIIMKIGSIKEKMLQYKPRDNGDFHDVEPIYDDTEFKVLCNKFGTHKPTIYADEKYSRSKLISMIQKIPVSLEYRDVDEKTYNTYKISANDLRKKIIGLNPVVEITGLIETWETMDNKVVDTSTWKKVKDVLNNLGKYTELTSLKNKINDLVHKISDIEKNIRYNTKVAKRDMIIDKIKVYNKKVNDRILSIDYKRMIMLGRQLEKGRRLTYDSLKKQYKLYTDKLKTYTIIKNLDKKISLCKKNMKQINLYNGCKERLMLQNEMERYNSLINRKKTSELYINCEKRLTQLKAIEKEHRMKEKLMGKIIEIDDKIKQCKDNIKLQKTYNGRARRTFLEKELNKYHELTKKRFEAIKYKKYVIELDHLTKLKTLKEKISMCREIIRKCSQNKEIKDRIEFYRRNIKYLEALEEKQTWEKIKKNERCTVLIKELSDKVNEINKVIKKDSDDLIYVKAEITNRRKRKIKHDEMTNAIKSLQKSYNELHHRINVYDEYKRLFNRKVIPRKILERSLVNFKRLVNELFHPIVKKYKFDYKIDKRSNVLNFVLSNGMSLSHLSGYEVLALRLAINQAVMSISNCNRGSLLIIDESFDCIDKNRFNIDLPMIIGKVKKYYSVILLISHRVLPQEVIDNEIIIKMKDSNSYIDK